MEDNVPYKLVWKSYVWNVDHGCDTVENLNRLVRSGDWKKLVMDSERHYNSEIRKVSQDLLKRKGEVRLMLIAGPSSSGKTTTTLKIGERLKEEGISFVILNCDNYFKSLEHHPKDEYGDYDFEGPEALDLPLINEHLQTLMKGKPVRMPIYDFKTGLHRYSDTLLHLEKNEILLIDSLHGLYPPLSESVAPEQKFRFYIEAICQIKDLSGNFVRWTDLRMLRRMIRDSHQRGCEPSRTVGHWHYVRRSEKRHIVPYIHTADSVFNGSLPYELPVHKTFLEKSLPEIIKKYDRDPKKMDASIRTHRVQKLLRSLSPFPDVRFIPKDSFLREFIGGSAYQY
ncbi:MAG: response regulator SirA [Elusimicrobia bacterium]|nr:response regulator SirA [Elusimicrobiota bacterium]